jgi:hypothetical protein
MVKQKVPDGEKIVSVIDYDDLLRYYSLNFYLGDRLRRVPTLNDVPDDAWLLTEPRDGLAGDTITAKSCDTRRPVILVRPQNKLKVTN